MKTVLGASLLGVAAASEGGTLKLSWSDCGDSSTHGHITSLTPDTVTLGTKTTLAGKGTVDEAIQGASYRLSAKAGGIPLFSHDGDACGPDTIKLPLGMGEIAMKGFSCPLSSGAVELDLDLSLAASIPSSMAKVDISLTAATTSGDKALCVNINTAPALSAVSDPEWIAFKTKYQKHYASDADEANRYQTFLKSKARVAKLNHLNKKAGDAFGINWMSDRYEEEKHKKGHVKPKGWVPTAPVKEFKSAARSPPSINWRDTEVITAIKNQGQCGSCWAFSATEAIESQMILGTGGKFAVALSPQQIASCAPSTGTYGCDGCNGGFTEGAYEYVKSAPGLANSFYIPYEQSLTESQATASCPTTKVQQIDGELQQLTGAYAQVTGYKYAVPPCTSGSCTNQDLAKLAQALEETPISVCVNAGSWNDYVGGVMTSAACGPMGADYQDHCVMATGFNATAPTPYWIVRNSWASTWGEDGYIYLEMAENTCGLADDATIPTVTLDMSAQQHAEAAIWREKKYQQATNYATQSLVV